MRVRHMLSLFLLLSITAVEVRAQSTNKNTSHHQLLLTQVLNKALTENPQLKAAGSKIDMMNAGIAPAGTLPDPVLGVNIMNLPVNSFRFNQEPMTGKQITLMQPIPFPGKLSLKTAIAKDQKSIAESSYAEMKNRLIARVKKTYYKLYFINQAITINDSNQKVLKHFVSIAEAKYQVGKGLQQDVLRSQLALSRLLNKAITLKNKRQTIESQLNTLMNLPPETPLGKPVLMEETIADTVYSHLMQLAAKQRPLLNSWRQMETQAGKKIDLAKRNRIPDFKIGVAYTQRDVLRNGAGGIDYVSGMFSVTLPIFSKRKQEKNIEQMKYNRQVISDQYYEVKNEVANRITQQLSVLRSTKQQIKLYKEGILPQARQSLQSALVGYQNDNVDFLTLLNNETSLYNYRLEYYQALSDYQIALAELKSEVGDLTN